MRGIARFFILLILLGIFSCSQRQEKDTEAENELIEARNDLFIDSMVFRYYKKLSRPYLLSSRAYAFNDSVTKVLDTMDFQKMYDMNLTDRSYTDPLLYRLTGDTLVVELIHTPLYGRFSFGEIRSRGDSIYLKLTGDLFRKLPRVSRKFNIPYRYFKIEFKMLVDSTRKYAVFFRRNDSSEMKP